MNAQITFLEGTLSLIHIPLNLYSSFLQPILQVFLPPSQQSLDPTSPHGESEALAVTGEDGFLNVSITPIECSVVCDSALAKKLFEPAIKKLPREAARTVSISRDSYAVFSVISAGMDAGSRVVDLTSPIALAGVPIFFITTYFSDFILVPTKDRQSVVQALLDRGFEFSENDASFKSPGSLSHARGLSHGSNPSSSSIPPSSPPPPLPASSSSSSLSNQSELQNRTFEQLKRRNVVPRVEPDLFLAQCSGQQGGSSGAAGGGYGHHHRHHRGSGSRSHAGGNGVRQRSWVDTVDTKLYTGLVAAVASQPRFLSVTLAQNDPPSLLLDKALLDVFGDALVGPTEGSLVPIFLDLENLPIEATGIVSGVAGRLVQDMQTGGDNPELSYLSTVRAGAVILSTEQSVRALEILRPLLVKE